MSAGTHPHALWHSPRDDGLRIFDATQSLAPKKWAVSRGHCAREPCDRHPFMLTRMVSRYRLPKPLEQRRRGNGVRPNVVTFRPGWKMTARA